MTLRYYQADLVSAIDDAWTRVPNVLAVSATGSGKTVVVAHQIRREPGASVFIAHRTELVAQASLALAREGVRHKVIGPASLQRNCAQIHMAELGRTLYDPNAKTAVAGVDTLVRLPPTDPWLQLVRLWVCDEGHHLVRGNKWGRAVEMFPNARGLSVTATPLRADGKGLGRHADGVIDVMVQGPPMSLLIAEGWLTKYRPYAPPNDIDLSAVATSASGDFSPDPLRKAVHRSSRIVGDVVDHYVRLAAGKLGMTFCVDVDAAVETAAAFRAKGVPAEVISGDTPELLRAQIMRRFRAREVHQLVSVDIMGEGTDVPAVEVVSFARPTQSFGLYVQQFGRALRPLEGKAHAIILDHVGNISRHGLPDAPRAWSLDRRERRASKGPSDAIPTRTCLNENCMSVYERVLLSCPYCGREAPPPAQRGSPEQVDGDLAELDVDALRRLRGDIARVDSAPLFPGGANQATMGAIKRNHWLKQQGQQQLRPVLELWGGWQRHQGRSEREAQRRFFLRYGVDVGTAQTLGPDEAATLLGQVRDDLERAGVVQA